MGFDAIAPYYDRLSRLVFGQSLIRAQTHFLHKINSNSRILVLGGGTGWWLKDLLRQTPSCKIVYVEPSVRMLKLAMEATGNDPRITFIKGTHGFLPIGEKFDAVIAFCFFDLFSSRMLPNVVEKIVKCIQPNGLLLVTDFVKTRWSSRCAGSESCLPWHRDRA